MFDWDDEELANVIWDEAGESEDHIVPYPDETYEKPSGLYGDQDAANVTEKTPVSITDSRLRVTTNGFDSLPDLSQSNATKLDLEHTDEKAQVDNQPEDKDAGNFVDYGWAHVGSFDDLDRILSDNDLVYGDANISNSEVLWSSTPKDVIGGPEKSELLSLANLEYGGGKNENLSKEKISQFSQSASEIIRRTTTNHIVCQIRDVNVAIPDKIATEKHVQMGDQSQKTKAQASCGPWFSHSNQDKEFEGRYKQHIKYSSSKPRNQQTECSPYKQFIYPDYKLRETQHSSVPALPQFHSGKEYQQVSSGSSSDKTPLMSVSIMTPQEKVEKLRRRQQMRALLAIRKQQQQFRHQNDYSNLGKYLHETQIDGSLSTLMSEQSDSDKSTLEDTILHQLENVISKLDIEIRLCIRDSLFRLAHNALRRQYDADKASSNRRSRDEASVIMEERLSSRKSSARSADGETKTNPIDRAVAHLLFHTPPGEFLHSPSSAKQTTSSAKGFPNESYEDDQFSCLIEQENKETVGGSRVEIEASSRGMPLL